MTTDFPDYQVPTAHATAIALAGVPLIHRKEQVATNTLSFVTIPSTQATGNQSVGAICYELFVSAANGASGSGSSYITVELDWFDSGTGLQLWTRQYKIVSGPNGSPHLVKIAGPVHGDTVNVTFGITSDSGFPVTVTYQLIQTSRLYPADVISSVIFSQQGFTSAGQANGYGVLADKSASVGAGGNQLWLMPPWNGRVHIAVTNTGLNNTVTVDAAEAFSSVPVLAGGADLWRLRTNANGEIDTFVTLPCVQCVLSVTNSDAAAHTVNVAVVKEASPQ